MSKNIIITVPVSGMSGGVVPSVTNAVISAAKP